MNKFFSIFLIVLGLLFLFGCTATPSACGDLVCQQGEELTCPTDCASAVDGQINVKVYAPYDARDVYVYWHKTTSISSNISANVTSTLAEHWSGSEYKNLFIAFDDTDSGEIPLGNKNEIVIDNLTQGEYYFEARTSDYSYRGVSEKVLVKEDGTYDVYLDLVPSNPAVRVKAYNKNYDNILQGPAKITATIIEERYEYGEYITNEYVYDVRTIKEDAEINELFFIPSYYLLRDDTYFTVNFLVEKDGYEDYSFNFRPYRQYSEYGINMKELPEPGTGNLEVQITPGQGTTWDDVYELSGEQGQLCGGPDYECYYSEINGYRVLFDDIPAGTYQFNASKRFGLEEERAPITTHTSGENLIVINDGDNLTISQDAFLGYASKLSLIDSQSNLIDLDEEPVYITQSCQIIDDYKQCYTYEEKYAFSENPYYLYYAYGNQDYLDKYLGMKLILTLEYKGEQKDFEINYGQGYDELNWQFDGNVSADLCQGDEFVSNINFEQGSAPEVSRVYFLPNGKVTFLDSNESFETTERFIYTINYDRQGDEEGVLYNQIVGDIQKNHLFYLIDFGGNSIPSNYDFDVSDPIILNLFGVDYVLFKSRIDELILSQQVLPTKIVINPNGYYQNKIVVSGINDYVGKSLNLELSGIGFDDKNNFISKWTLKEDTTIIDVVTDVTIGDDLADKFKDYFSNRILISAITDDDGGIVSINTTNGVLDIKDNKAFPYSDNNPDAASWIGTIAINPQRDITAFGYLNEDLTYLIADADYSELQGKGADKFRMGPWQEGSKIIIPNPNDLYLSFETNNEETKTTTKITYCKNQRILN